jgi:hypothetical protein
MGGCVNEGLWNRLLEGIQRRLPCVIGGKSSDVVVSVVPAAMAAVVFLKTAERA